MITFTDGNLLAAPVDALVNTVNEVGVMGKGIALMFKECFPENYRTYERACKRGEVRVGHVFVVANLDSQEPKWIVNFPTKKHWRNPSQIEWIREGLTELRAWILDAGIKSIAVPPLGCGNGGLHWRAVKKLINETLSDLHDVDVQVYSPTPTYQNKPKKLGVQKLTPARAMIAEMVHRYGILGFDCSLLEVQKLAWFIQRGLAVAKVDNPLKLVFQAGKYGPYSDNLRHILEGLDGSYLRSSKRIADANPHDTISFEEESEGKLNKYFLQARMRKYAQAMRWTEHMIEGFETPFGMELLATVDWLIYSNAAQATLESVRSGVERWPYSIEAAKRKAKLFDERVLSIALRRVQEANSFHGAQKALSLT